MIPLWTHFELFVCTVVWTITQLWDFVDALKISIINGLYIKSLCDTDCEDDGATVLDNLQSLLRAPNGSSPNSSTSHGKETPDTVPESFHVAQQVQKDIGNSSQ
jgi:hypothetical protein